ncbi:hypothetical protein ABW20_dc0107557 [Dactylellina cionopaga]|nr:hypothetical protein ABW20_dc0107557 [Dactylellina cionopaga]
MKSASDIITHKFKLRALDKDGLKDEYYGLRKDTDKKRLKHVFDSYSKEITKREGDTTGTKNYIKDLETRMKSPNFTDNFDEHVGINTYDEGCIFEIDLRRDEPQAYHIYNSKFESYLSADPQQVFIQSEAGVADDVIHFGYAYYCAPGSAAYWAFRSKEDPTRDGPVEEGMEVELMLLNDEYDAIGVVERFKGDKCTLLISMFGVKNDPFTVSHKATMEYLSD